MQEKAFQSTFRGALGLSNTEWVQWVHRQYGKSHCETCLKLDNCWFLDDKKPKLPQHFFCHCITENVPYETVKREAVSVADYSKFDPYLFNSSHTYTHNKEKMFESWGYTVVDAAWMQAEIGRQGQEKYVQGEYELGLLNAQGQRINIRVEIPRKDGSGTVSFVTGWMVYPEGKIRLVTPYGGK